MPSCESGQNNSPPSPAASALSERVSCWSKASRRAQQRALHFVLSRDGSLGQEGYFIKTGYRDIGSSGVKALPVSSVPLLVALDTAYPIVACSEVRGGELVQWVQPSSGKAMDARRDALGPTLPLVRVSRQGCSLSSVLVPSLLGKPARYEGLP